MKSTPLIFLFVFFIPLHGNGTPVTLRLKDHHNPLINFLWIGTSESALFVKSTDNQIERSIHYTDIESIHLDEFNPTQFDMHVVEKLWPKLTTKNQLTFIESLKNFPPEIKTNQLYRRLVHIEKLNNQTSELNLKEQLLIAQAYHFQKLGLLSEAFETLQETSTLKSPFSLSNEFYLVMIDLLQSQDNIKSAKTYLAFALERIPRIYDSHLAYLETHNLNSTKETP